MYSFYDAFRQLSTADDGFMSGSHLSIARDRKWAGETWTVLEEDAGGLKVEYFIDTNSHLIWRTVQRDAATNEVSYESFVHSMEL